MTEAEEDGFTLLPLKTSFEDDGQGGYSICSIVAEFLMVIRLCLRIMLSL